MNRSTIRELTFKYLYGAEIQKELTVEQIEDFLASNEIEDKNAKKYMLNTISGIIANQTEIIDTIEKNLKEGWNLDRISKVSLSLLKLSIFEIVYEELPFKAIINDVVELAKNYGEDTAPTFVNGVLASVVREKQEKE